MDVWMDAWMDDMYITYTDTSKFLIVHCSQLRMFVEKCSCLMGVGIPVRQLV